ncbi:MAG: hypothetical protein R3212_09660 [Xanthomonadales bacterium]|nr:hypothetical protein [Xanthomonadales bacterium]
MIKLSTFCIRATLSALVFAIATPAMAQDGPPGNVAEMWTVYVDFANQPAFEEAVKGYMALAKEMNAPQHWEAYKKNTGDDFDAYYFRTCCFSWADRDAIDAWHEANPALQENWNANAHPHVSGYEHDFETIDFENSHWPEDMAEPKFVGVTTHKLKSGSGQQFNAVKDELSQIAKNHGWSEQGHEWAWVESVNGKYSVSLAIPHMDYADMADPDPSFFEFLSGHLGSDEAAAAKFEAFSSAIEGSYYEIYTHYPDLSTPD